MCACVRALSGHETVNGKMRIWNMRERDMVIRRADSGPAQGRVHSGASASRVEINLPRNNINIYSVVILLVLNIGVLILVRLRVK